MGERVAGRNVTMREKLQREKFYMEKRYRENCLGEKSYTSHVYIKKSLVTKTELDLSFTYYSDHCSIAINLL